jgi:hypothetical protein
MNLGERVPARPLGVVDIGALSSAMDRLEAAAWLRNTMRQQRYQVHRQTHSIVFAWTENDWTRGSPMQTQRFHVDAALDDAAWEIARQIVDRVGAGHVAKLMLAKLLAGGKVLPHRDTGDCLLQVHRVHVPLRTNPLVRFTVGESGIRMHPGEVVEINNSLIHSVDNPSAEDRVHLICDVLPG